MPLSVALAVIGMFCLSVAAWITHIVACIGAITGVKVLGGILMLAFGVLIPPLGVIHGLMIWFGAGLF